MHTIRVLLATIVVLLTANSLHAGNCNSFFRAQRVVAVKQTYAHSYVAPVVAVKQPIYYGVGDYSQYQAIQTVKLRNDPGFQEFLQVLGQYREYQAYKIGLAQAKAQEQTSLIVQKCGSCHGTQLATPKGETFVPSTDIPAETITKALRMIRDDKMPPEKPLTGQEKAEIMEELLSGETK